MRLFFLFILSNCLLNNLTATPLDPNQPQVINHAELKSYTNHGNTLIGVATPLLGATEIFNMQGTPMQFPWRK
jgi:hypothetical protein